MDFALKQKSKCFLVMFSILLVIGISGCRRTVTADTPLPKIKQMLRDTDKLTLVERYDEKLISDPSPAPKEDPTYHFISETISGAAAFEPIVATNQKSGEKYKGCRISLTDERWRVAEKSGGGDTTDYLLDEDEVKDLEASLVRISGAYTSWKNEHPDHERKLSFGTKDGLQVALVQAKGGELHFYLNAVDSPKMIVELQPAKIDEMHSDALDVLKVLSDH